MIFSRILLLGKDGQIGAALLPRLMALGETFAYGHATCDLSIPDQLRAVIRGVRPSLIVNAAAYTAVDKAESDEQTCHRINAVAPGILAEEAKAVGAWLIHYSTDYIFDGTKMAAYLEDDVPSPLNVYGRSKLEGDRAIADTIENYIILRVSWVYGAAGRNFARTILKLATERDELRIVADQFGAPTSAELIADVTREVIKRLTIGETESSVRGVYNLAPSGRTSWHGYALELLREAKKQGRSFRLSEHDIIPVTTDQYPTPAARPKNSVLDTQKIRKVFGVELPAWQASLEQFISQLGL